LHRFSVAPGDQALDYSRGITKAFMILLSSKPDFTFILTDALFEVFPFEDYELEAYRDEAGLFTIFRLHNLNVPAH
jgi:ureidoglycolate hydrolase